MYMNPYYRHIQDLKREMVRITTKEDMHIIKHMLMKKVAKGNMKAAEMMMKVTEWQRELDHAADQRHELNVIMGAPTDGLMRRMRPGQISLSKPDTENKQAQ